MKKGKTSKLSIFDEAKCHYGTVDSKNLKSIYLVLQTWVEPITEQDNWNKITGELKRQILHTLLEINNKEVTGYHNWVKYYRDENKGEIKIKNIINITDLYDYKKVTLSMNWNGKNISGFIIGISPIVEFIVKTFIILLDKEKVEFNGGIVIKTFRNGSKVSTIYFV